VITRNDMFGRTYTLVVGREHYGYLRSGRSLETRRCEPRGAERKRVARVAVVVQRRRRT
jgi:hypothetical protein